MKALLKILYFFLIVIVLFLLAGIFFPKTSAFETSIITKAQPEIVFNQLQDLQNWKNWSPWRNNDSTMTINYGEKTIGEGAYFNWESENLGKGKISILNAEDNSIELLLDLYDGGTAITYFKLDTLEGNTEITWGFTDDTLSYIERYFVFLFKRNINITFTKGLADLKEVTEDLRLSRVSDVTLEEYAAQPAMIIVDSAYIEEIEERKPALYEKLRTYMQRRNIAPVGEPFTLYFTSIPQGAVKYGVGYPIRERTWGWKNYQVVILPQGKVATITHWGDFNSRKPYASIDVYMKNMNLNPDAFIWENYTVNSSVETDTSYWEKKVYVPIYSNEQ